jgi:hypothetical protein
VTFNHKKWRVIKQKKWYRGAGKCVFQIISEKVFFGCTSRDFTRDINLQTTSESDQPLFSNCRATSITNVAYTGAPLSRRSSERELVDGSKKRATSASGLDRQSEGESFFCQLFSNLYSVNPCYFFKLLEKAVCIFSTTLISPFKPRKKRANTHPTKSL